MPTEAQMREAYILFLQKTRKPEPEAFVQFTEMDMAAFIRKHVDANFDGIYERTDRHFYDRVRNMIATNAAMSTEDNESELQYSIHLRTYSQFLDSKEFKQLTKPKKSPKETASPSTSTHSSNPNSTPSKPKERELTEGEKKHVAYEITLTNDSV